MAEDQKDRQKENSGCCGGMPFEDMMRKMAEIKKSGQPFNCMEMMSQMMQMFHRAEEKKEDAPVGSKKNPAL
jgi:hypothetical protein